MAAIGGKVWNWTPASVGRNQVLWLLHAIRGLLLIRGSVAAFLALLLLVVRR